MSSLNSGGRSESLLDLTRGLEGYLESGDQFQLGRMLGYSVLKGLDNFIIPQDIHSVPEIKYAEMVSIYNHLKSILEDLRQGVQLAGISSSLENDVNQNIEIFKKRPSGFSEKSILLRNIMSGIDANPSKYSSIICWNGRVLYNNLSKNNPAYRSQDAATQDYQTIQKVFVRNKVYNYSGEK
jgi:hypothetical protein